MSLQLRSTLVFPLLAGLCWLALPCRAQDSTGTRQTALRLTDLLKRVDSHPMVRMRQSDLAASRHRVSMRSSLMNPMVMLGVDNVPVRSFRFDQEMMTAKSIGLSQSFRWPGKLGSEEDVAYADTLSPYASVQEQQNLLRKKVKVGYYSLYHLNKEILTDRAHLAAIEKLIEIGQERLAVGKSPQLAVLNLQLEASEMKSQISEQETMLAMQRSEIAQSAGVESIEIRVPDTLDYQPFNYTLNDLMSYAASTNPQLMALRGARQKQDAQLRLNDLSRYPDFDISLMYMQRNALAADAQMNPMNSEAAKMLGMQSAPMAQSDMLSARITIPLPIFYGNQRIEERAELEAMQQGNEAEIAGLLLDIRTMLEADLAKLRGIERQRTLLINEIYPVAEASLATSNVDFQYGKADLEQVLRNELNVLHKEHARYEFEAQYQATIADMEYLTGRDLVEHND